LSARWGTKTGIAESPVMLDIAKSPTFRVVDESAQYPVRNCLFEFLNDFNPKTAPPVAVLLESEADEDVSSTT
jgi:hypothetical protein